MRIWAKLHQGLFMQSAVYKSVAQRNIPSICQSVIQGQFPNLFFCLDRKVTQLQAFKRTSLKDKLLLFF